MSKIEHRFLATKYHYTFGPNEPVLKVKPGDIIITETVDAGGYDSNGMPIPDEMKQKSQETEFYHANPLVGPFYVEGAKYGDTLVARINKITLNRNTAYSKIHSHFGSLTEEGPGKRLLFNEPLDEQYYLWNIDHEKRLATLNLHKSRTKRIEIPLEPFIGSIGVAPRYGRVETSLSPGEYGGNMDCIETKEGTTIYFPVFVNGAYLAFGDIHAVQGDGELCGTALETTAEVAINIDLVKNKAIEWPRFEDQQFIMVAGSSKPLMEAYKIAHIELIDWLVTDYGFERYEALQLLTQVGTSRIGNVVDPKYTIVAKFPKAYLK